MDLVYDWPHKAKVIQVFIKPERVYSAFSRVMELETDKATHIYNLPRSGSVLEVYVKAGDTLTKGSKILRFH